MMDWYTPSTDKCASSRPIDSPFGAVFVHFLAQSLLLRSCHVDKILHTLPRAFAGRRRRDDLLQHGLQLIRQPLR